LQAQMHRLRLGVDGKFSHDADPTDSSVDSTSRADGNRGVFRSTEQVSQEVRDAPPTLTNSPKV
jgi:hypothetical protein